MLIWDAHWQGKNEVFHKYPFSLRFFRQCRGKPLYPIPPDGKDRGQGSVGNRIYGRVISSPCLV